MPDVMQFEDDGCIPNNPYLPLVIYRDVLPDGNDRVGNCQALFAQNGWHGSWVNGVYSYHHYHSTAHEVLGVTGGSADLQLGGEQGEIIRVQTGDVLIIPAGVGHCRLNGSPDFRVVGAYPQGQDWDLRTGSPDERPAVLENIRAVPLPAQDPVFGREGFLMETWQAPV